MITKEQLKKAASMWDSKMSWQAIAETLGVDQHELREACERVAGLSLKDWAAAATQPGERLVAGYKVVKKEAPPMLRSSLAGVLAGEVAEGDCIEAVKSAGMLTSLRRHLAPRGLTVKCCKRLGQKLWDVYVVKLEPARAKGRKGK